VFLLLFWHFLNHKETKIAKVFFAFVPLCLPVADRVQNAITKAKN
jgi:hypothetical protein